MRSFVNGVAAGLVLASAADAPCNRPLVMHGMADDNVLFTRTTQLIKELVAARNLGAESRCRVASP